MPFSLFLAFKYLKPKRSITSVITCVSVLGVALGVASLVVVRSMFAGFGEKWNEKLADLYPHITIQSVSLGVGKSVIPHAEEMAERLSQIEGIAGVTPQISSLVMLRNKSTGLVQVPLLLGVENSRFQKVYKIGSPLAGGTFDLESQDYAVVLGIDLARKLGVSIGDKIQIGSVKMLERLVSNDEKPLPLLWTVVGIFDSHKYEIDVGVVLVSLANARDLLELDAGAEEIVMKTTVPPYDHRGYFPIFDRVRTALEQIPHGALRLLSWRQGEGTRRMTEVLDTEKGMTTLLMALITVVAVFCVMNTLLILIVQKTPEIGLLKALGFSNWKIMSAFLVHGMIQCVMGIALGFILALLVIHHLEAIIHFLNGFGRDVFPKEVYGLSLPKPHLETSTVFLAIALALVSGLLASLVPAYLASRKNPVEALEK